MHLLLDHALQVGSPQALASAASLFESHTHDKGAVLLHQGAIWDKAFLVEHGLIRMHLLGRDGKEFNKSFHAEGALICPITTDMECAPSLFAISVIEASVIWQAPATALRTGLAQSGAWESLRSKLMERLLTHKLQREHDLLTLDGTTRYQHLCQAHPQLAARVPLAHLASYLGLTDVSLSRIRRQLKTPGEARHKL